MTDRTRLTELARAATPWPTGLTEVLLNALSDPDRVLGEARPASRPIGGRAVIHQVTSK